MLGAATSEESIYDSLIASMIADESNAKPSIQTIIAGARMHEERTRK